MELIITKLYQYVKASLLFWIYLIRGFVVYGLVPAFCSLIAVTEDVKKDQDHEKISVLFSRYYQKYNIFKLQSFLLSFLLIITYNLLFFTVQSQGSYSLIVIFILLYILGITIIVITYTCSFLVFCPEKVNFKQAIALAFVSTIKHFGVSIILLCLLGLLFAIAGINFLLFIFIAPVLYTYLISFVIQVMIKRIFLINKSLF
ncbi:hypothetical protein [Anaerobacillus sp.]|uniref:hypothetical protein n=1 Tax=Anaerobacillus sp. TaxID=1872506 RepID=UPI003918923D